MMNDPNAPMGGQPPMGQPPMGAEAPMGQEGAVDDAVLDMHLTEDVKKALQAKGVDITAVADRGPQEPVVVIPVSVIISRYPADSPEQAMQQFVQDMTANAQAPATEQPVSASPEMAAAEAPPPSPEGLGAPMDRPPMTA
jgi:pyruvate/2-oxoglutarate dehydrogenase complex dihydrolipoamide acyltransferase (E2) component